MQLLWNYLKEHKRILIGALVLATINQVFSLLDPQIFRYTIDHYATRIGELSQGEFVRGVGLLLLAGVGVAFVSRVAKNFQDYYTNVVVQRVGTKMYSTSVSHSFSLPYSVFEDQRSGEFLQKLQKARSDAQTFITSTINVVFLSAVSTVFVLIYSFIVNWTIAVTFIVMIPLLGGIIFYISGRIKKITQQVIRETASLAGSTTETIRNVELVKSLGLEQQEIQRLNDVNEKILQLELYKIRLVRMLSFVQGTLINAMRSSLTFLLLWLTFTQAITLGEFFSLLFYSFFVFQPLYEFGTFSQTYQEAKASMERLDEIFKTKPEEKPANPVTIQNIREIEFKGVSFHYPSAPDRPAVTDLDFKIEAGSSVAFVGPSGSGKTTIIKLLVGLYKPTSGRIAFNGRDARDLDFDKIRSKMGLVSQDTQLFAGTIRENLLFAHPSATDEECMQALRSAQAVNLVERGDQGLETRIGEGGLKLSGGEKQRLAIARALLRKPELVIFDEATSSLDSLTEEQITQTIREIEKNHPNLITVLVAHRLSTIAHASTIFVLEKGKIVEQGRHSALLDKGGLYAALWRQQVAVQEAPGVPAKAGA
jgi:ATP-binding cassette, subfamily B, bacterial